MNHKQINTADPRDAPLLQHLHNVVVSKLKIYTVIEAQVHVSGNIYQNTGGDVH